MPPAKPRPQSAEELKAQATALRDALSVLERDTAHLDAMPTDEQIASRLRLNDALRRFLES